MRKIRWGILSTAKIAREKVIPAMQKGMYSEVFAIASRNFEHAEAVAKELGIQNAYGSYESLLADDNVDAVYIPLPNNMHVEWSKKALEAGKHVLCEKPIGLNAAQAGELMDTAGQKPALKIMEAFMYRFHPQWILSKKMVMEGKIGELKNVQSFFSYYNVDINNIRNRKDAGGGSVMDIGCYCISFPRFLFDREPSRVSAMVEYDPVTGVDRLASGIMDFSPGLATFTCATQLMPYQRVNILGSHGRIEVEIPVNTPPDKATSIWLHTKEGSEEITFDPVDQYALQADEFSKAILNNTPVPTDLGDAINNMKVIEAVFQSAGNNSWKNI